MKLFMMPSGHVVLRVVEQLLFLGLSKCLPESDFYLPRAFGLV